MESKQVWLWGRTTHQERYDTWQYHGPCVSWKGYIPPIATPRMNSTLIVDPPLSVLGTNLKYLVLRVGRWVGGFSATNYLVRPFLHMTRRSDLLAIIVIVI